MNDTVKPTGRRGLIAIFKKKDFLPILKKTVPIRVHQREYLLERFSDISQEVHATEHIVEVKWKREN